MHQTCWRGITVSHPAQWELAVASGPDMPGQCIFADRIAQRLDVQWREVSYIPNLDLMLDKFRSREKDGGERPEILRSAPDPWRGIVRKVKNGALMVHAGRYFQSHKLLFEVTMLWPDRRDEDAEAAVLESVAPLDPQNGRRHWLAMGMDIHAPEDFEVRSQETAVGRIAWELKSDKRPNVRLFVERLAMPHYWLRGPLREWLAEQLPEKSRTVRQEALTVGPHRHERIVSRKKTSPIDTLRSLSDVRLDWAWICPLEDRAYHASFTERRRDEDISPPKGLEIHCCRKPPAVARRSA